MLSTQPGISLGVQVPQPAAAGGLAANPLGLINTLSELQLRMNQNALFQQTFMANQQMGQIMAGAPSIDAGIAGILRSPAAPFSGPFLNNLRSMDKTMLDISLAKAGAAQGVVQNYTKSLAAAYADPTMLPALRAMAMATAAPEAAGPAAAAIDSLNTALLDGVVGPATSGDPNQIAWAHKVFQNRVLGTLTPQLDANVLRSMAGVVTPGVEQGPYGPGGGQMPFGVGGSIYGTPAVTGLPTAAGPLGPNAMAATPAGANALGGATVAPAPGPGGALVGPGVAERAAMEKSGAAAGQISEDLSAAAKNLPEDLNRINLMQQALGKFQAGGLAGFRSDMASVLQGFKNAGVPISQATIDKVGNESLADTQVFQATVRPEVINELKQAATGTGRVMRSEVDAFLAMMSPNIDPEALRTLLNRAKYQAAVQYDQTQKFQQYRTGGGNPLDFYANYNRTMDPYGLATKAGGGLDFSPIPASQIKGAPAGADLWKGWGEQGQISRTAVERLRQNPALARDFEERFGLPAGGAQQYMGGGQ